MNNQKKKDKNRKNKSILEDEVFKIIQLSMKEALDKAIDDLLKEWK